MKRLLLSLMVLGLMGLSVAVAPTVYSVVITPLYGNIGSTLTCNYISSNASASAKYRFYDNGVWYNSASATYSTALVSGRSYNCSVNLTGGGASTGWKNSSTLAVIGDYCVNPYPLLFKNTRGNLNLTSLLSTMPFNVIAYGAGYGLTTAHNKVVMNKSIILLGGEYTSLGVRTITFWTKTTNIMKGETASGVFALTTSTTDEDLATYTQTLTTLTSYQYSTYLDINETIPINTNLKFKTSIWGADAGATKYVSIEGYSGASWYTLASHSTTSVSEVVYTDYHLATRAYTQIRVGIKNSAGGFTTNLRVYEIEMQNWSSGTISNTVSASMNIANFTSDGGYLYGYNYHDEEAGTAFSFITSGALNSSRIDIGCVDASSLTLNVTNNGAGKNYMIGTTEDLRHIKTYLIYDDGSELFRVNTPICTSTQYQLTDQYLPNAGTFTVRAYTFNLDDQTADKRYEDGWLKVKRTIGGGVGVQTLHAQDWGGTKSVLTFLIDNREYIVSLVADDCSENALGYVTSNPTVTTFSLSASGSTVNTTYFNDAYENFRYFFDYAPPSTRINFTYNDSDGAVDWVWWGVYDTDNGTLMYSDNSTAHNYKGSYVVTNSSKRYYGAVIFRRNNQTISDIVEGGLTRQEDYLEDLDYTGEILGLEYPTLFMLLSLAVISMTALLVSPASVGVGLMMGWAETLFFSVIGWLPLISSGVGSGDWTSQAGWIVLTLGFIICAMVMYTEKR